MVGGTGLEPGRNGALMNGAFQPINHERSASCSERFARGLVTKNPVGVSGRLRVESLLLCRGERPATAGSDRGQHPGLALGFAEGGRLVVTVAAGQ